MSSRQIVVRLAVVIAVSAAVACGVGLAVGFGFYFVVYDPDSQAKFNGLGESIIGAGFGALTAMAAYCGLSLRGVRRVFPREMITLSLMLRVLGAPFVFLSMELVVMGVWQPEGVVYLLQQLVVLTAWVTIVFPIAPRRFAAIAPVAAVAVIITLAVIGSFRESSDYGQSYEEAFQKWNGPLVLVNGNTTSMPDPDWKTLRIAAPSDNDPYSTVQLHWRQNENSVESQKDVVVGMRNQPLSAACRYDNCDLVGQTKFGPIYRSDTTGDYLVEVAGGRLDLSVWSYSGDPISLINSLELVDAGTFAAAAKKAKS